MEVSTSKRVTNHFKGLLAGHGSTRKAGKMRLRLNGNSTRWTSWIAFTSQLVAQVSGDQKEFDQSGHRSKLFWLPTW